MARRKRSRPEPAAVGATAPLPAGGTAAALAGAKVGAAGGAKAPATECARQLRDSQADSAPGGVDEHVFAYSNGAGPSRSLVVCTLDADPSGAAGCTAAVDGARTTPSPR